MWKSIVYKISLYVFVFSMPFDPDWNSKALILLIICSLFNIDYNGKLLTKSIFLNSIIILCVYVLFNVAIYSLEFNTPLFSLIGLLILFFLLINQTHLKPNLSYLSFVSLLAVIVVGIINLLNLFISIDNFGIKAIFNAWEKYSLIDIHKIYYSCYLNMAYLTTIYFLLKSRWNYLFVALLFIVSCFLHYFTGSIGGIIIFLLINFIVGFYYLINKYYHVLIKILFFGPVLLMFLLTSHVFQGYFKKIDGEGSRIRNYNVNKQIFYDAPVFGHGIGVELETMQQYRNVGSWEYLQEYNAHNQYFQFIIGGGLILLFLFFVPLYLLYQHSLYSKFALMTHGFLIIILYVFLVESLLERHHGIMFLAFYFSYFAFAKGGVIIKSI